MSVRRPAVTDCYSAKSRSNVPGRILLQLIDLYSFGTLSCSGPPSGPVVAGPPGSNGPRSAPYLPRDRSPEEFLESGADVLSNPAGDQRTGPSTRTGTEQHAVRTAWHPHLPHYRGKNLRRLRRADTRSAPPRAGYHQRARPRAARRTGDRRQRSHLHLRAAHRLLRVHPRVPQRAASGGPLLRRARRSGCARQPGRFRHYPTARPGEEAPGRENPHR